MSKKCCLTCCHSNTNTLHGVPVCENPAIVDDYHDPVYGTTSEAIKCAELTRVGGVCEENTHFKKAGIMTRLHRGVL